MSRTIQLLGVRRRDNPLRAGAARESAIGALRCDRPQAGA